MVGLGRIFECKIFWNTLLLMVLLLKNKQRRLFLSPSNTALRQGPGIRPDFSFPHGSPYTNQNINMGLIAKCCLQYFNRFKNFLQRVRGYFFGKKDCPNASFISLYKYLVVPPGHPVVIGQLAIGPLFVSLNLGCSLPSQICRVSWSSFEQICSLISLPSFRKIYQSEQILRGTDRIKTTSWAIRNYLIW